MSGGNKALAKMVNKLLVKKVMEPNNPKPGSSSVRNAERYNQTTEHTIPRCAFRCLLMEILEIVGVISSIQDLGSTKGSTGLNRRIHGSSSV